MNKCGYFGQGPLNVYLFQFTHIASLKYLPILWYYCITHITYPYYYYGTIFLVTILNVDNKNIN